MLTNSSPRPIAADQLAQARNFLAKVVPWPAPGEPPAYVNICNTFHGPGYSKPAWAGRAVTSINEAINYIHWAFGQPDTVGIYACMSTQQQPGEAKATSNGYTYYKANRNQPNAVALKSLWLDIDTKLTHDDAEYQDLPQAAAALADFVKATAAKHYYIQWRRLTAILVHVARTHAARMETVGVVACRSHQTAWPTVRHRVHDRQCTRDACPGHGKPQS
jgi:hypothetical protein